MTGRDSQVEPNVELVGEGEQTIQSVLDLLLVADLALSSVGDLAVLDDGECRALRGLVHLARQRAEAVHGFWGDLVVIARPLL